MENTKMFLVRRFAKSRCRVGPQIGMSQLAVADPFDRFLVGSGT